jgi:hypothetical protein
MEAPVSAINPGSDPVEGGLESHAADNIVVFAEAVAERSELPSVVAEFCGGQADGRRQAVPLDRFGEPPAEVRLLETFGVHGGPAVERVYRLDVDSAEPYRYVLEVA